MKSNVNHIGTWTEVRVCGMLYSFFLEIVPSLVVVFAWCDTAAHVR